MSCTSLKVDIGAMRHSIVFYEPVTALDAYRAKAITWTSRYTRWASIEPLAGRELYHARQSQSDASFKIVTWADSTLTSNVTPSWRIYFGSRVFAIESIRNPMEIGQVLEFYAKETDGGLP